jgi:hypothetical protein
LGVLVADSVLVPAGQAVAVNDPDSSRTLGEGALLSLGERFVVRNALARADGADRGLVFDLVCEHDAS